MDDAPQFAACRLNDAKPIISADSFRSVGAHGLEAANINGPSVIRVPDWIPPAERASPEAEYYLYFAHHVGRYVRLAWSPSVTGPWQLYNCGRGSCAGKRGVLDIGDARRLELGDALTIRTHVASPDVHIDNDQQRLIMYFHGPVEHTVTRTRSQRSLVATSRWGLDFARDIKPVVLGPSYFRVFSHQGELYAVRGQALYHARDRAEPWAAPQQHGSLRDLWPTRTKRLFDAGADVETQTWGWRLLLRRRSRARRVRHVALHRSGDRLHVFFTVIGHEPERILVTSVDLGADGWQTSPRSCAPAELLRPQHRWEGSGVRPAPSRSGNAIGLQAQLRDPFVFEDDGALYLFYVGGGEQGIGLARLDRVANDNE